MQYSKILRYYDPILNSMMILSMKKLLLLLACGLLASATTARAVAITQEQPLPSPLLKTYAATMKALPGKTDHNVSGTIMIATTAPDFPENSTIGRDADTWLLFYGGFLRGLEANVDAETDCGGQRCTVMLHLGTCDKIKGRVYACGAMQDADQDPWNAARYSTDSEGRGSIQSFFTVPNYGIQYEGPVDDHVLVVRSSKDKTKIACGAVRPISAFAANNDDDDDETDPVITVESQQTTSPTEETRTSEDNDMTTSVVVLRQVEEAAMGQQQECFIGYAEGSMAKVEDFLTTATTDMCTANNSQIIDFNTGGGESTATAAPKGGKAWFGGCTTTRTTVLAGSSVPESKPSSSGGGGGYRVRHLLSDSIVLDDAELDTVSCGFQEERPDPPTQSPTSEPELVEDGFTAVSLKSEEGSSEGLDAASVSSSSNGALVPLSVVSLAATMLHFILL